MRAPASLVRCLCRSLPARPASALRIPLAPRLSGRIRPQLSAFHHVRYESTPAAAPPKPSTTPPDSRLERDQVPSYELTFTCKKCTTRSSHRISKQGYHHGTVLISCPGCKNRHLISDHLKVFSDKPVTIEDLMREKGQLVRRGSLEGDMELWDDGTSTPRSAHFIPQSTTASEGDPPRDRLTEPPSSSSSPSASTQNAKRGSTS